MGSSSTRVPFMLAGLIAVIVNNINAEFNDNSRVNEAGKVAVSTKVVLLENPKFEVAQK